MLNLNYLKPSSESLAKWLIIALVAVPIFGYGIYKVFGASIISKTLPSADSGISGLIGHWSLDGKDINTSSGRTATFLPAVSIENSVLATLFNFFCRLWLTYLALSSSTIMMSYMPRSTC